VGTGNIHTHLSGSSPGARVAKAVGRPRGLLTSPLRPAPPSRP